jgi:hypothetical protein
MFYFKDGSFYEGTFVNGVAEGQGRYIFNTGCVYEGGIKNDEASGHGTYIDRYQMYEYEGNWLRDVPSGFGK